MKLSIIIPVHNEQERINSLIEHLKSLGDFEIIVSDSNGETNNIIIHKDIIKKTSAKGRGNQLNAGAEKATGDVYLFLHCDTVLTEGFDFEIEKGLKTHSAGAFALKIDSKSLFFRLIEKGVSIRNKITKIPYGDQAQFCSREAFDKIKGFKDIPIMEDVRIMKDFKKSGIKIYLSKMPVLTSPRRWEKEGLVYTTLRNWFIILLYNMGVSPHALKRLYK
ncbi:MAG: glycosyltransferase [Denitrovibrio sp.]|nr:MAG: glycosyltransferase [Denitrovibrio sp.]